MKSPAPPPAPRRTLPRAATARRPAREKASPSPPPVLPGSPMATSESDGDASPAPGEMSLARVRRDPPPFAVDDDAENATAPRRSSPRRDTYPYATSTEEDRAAETMVSSSRNTLPASARTRSVSVPVFSVAGKRVSIDQLLREKVQQASKAGRHQVMSAFRTMRDGAGTRVGREDVRRCLARFNLLGASSSFDDDEVLDALFSRFDVDGDGAIDFKEFAGTLLPADFPSDLTEVDRRVANVALPLNGLMGKPKPPRDVATIRGRAGTAEGVEALLRAKLAEKFGESGAAMRRAFAAFDVDGDGVLRFDEFESTTILAREPVPVAGAGASALLPPPRPNKSLHMHSLNTWSATRASRALRGSSRSTIWEFAIVARAKDTRWRCPPENWCG